MHVVRSERERIKKVLLGGRKKVCCWEGERRRRREKEGVGERKERGVCC
jgi:hypothetical protein